MCSLGQKENNSKHTPSDLGSLVSPFFYVE